MSINHIVRTPRGNKVASVMHYITARHPSARKVHHLAEVLIELPDGTFVFEVLPISALSITAAPAYAPRPKLTAIIRDEVGEEIGRMVDDRNPGELSDEEWINDAYDEDAFVDEYHAGEHHLR